MSESFQKAEWYKFGQICATIGNILIGKDDTPITAADYNPYVCKVEEKEYITDDEWAKITGAK